MGVLLLVLLSSVNFSGRFQFLAYYDSTAGMPSSSCVRWIFEPQINIAGMPVKLNLNFIRPEVYLKEQLESFTISFSPERLIPHLPGVPSFFLKFPGIDIGYTEPFFSPLVLSGITIKGFNIKYSPWKIFIQSASGYIESSMDSLYYRREIRAYKFGVGRPEYSHVHFHFLHSWDAGATSEDTISPMENFVVGMESRLSIKRAISLFWELNVSEITEDTRDTVISKEDIPGWIREIFKPRLSSHADLAFNGGLQLQAGGLSVATSTYYVGPGYRSFGADNVKTDVLGYKVEINLSTFNGLVNLGSSISNYRDNLLNDKVVTTKTSDLSVYFGISPVRLPSLFVSYEIVKDRGEVEILTRNYSLSSGYGYSLAGTFMFTGISFSHQENVDSLSGSPAYNTLSLNHSISLKIPLSINLFASAISGDYSSTSSGFDFSYMIGNLRPYLGMEFISEDENRSSFFRAGLNGRLPLGFNIYGQARISGGERSQRHFNLSIVRNW